MSKLNPFETDGMLGREGAIAQAQLVAEYAVGLMDEIRVDCRELYFQQIAHHIVEALELERQREAKRVRVKNAAADARVQVAGVG